MSTPDTENVCIGYGTNDGEIKFGHIHEDGVVSAVSLRSGQDPDHYISLDGNVRGEPHRRNGTMCVSPGSFQVIAGETVRPDLDNGIFLLAENGDLVIRAPNGRIRMEAQNIDIRAEGFNGENGVITLDTNEKIILIAGQSVDVRSKVSTKIFSDKTVEVVGNSLLNIYGGLIESMDGATDALTAKGSKMCPAPTPATIRELRQRILSFLQTIS